MGDENVHNDPYISLRHVLKNNRIRRFDTIEDSFDEAETGSALVIVQNDQWDGHMVDYRCNLETVMVSFF
jgi:hypothetical protein